MSYLFRLVSRLSKSFSGAPSWPALVNVLSSKETVRQIANSDLFDEEFYLRQVEAAGIGLQAISEPVSHYVETGEQQGLRPSLRFDPGFYRHAYGDLHEFPGNLLSHFIKHGRREGRFPTASTQWKAFNLDKVALADGLLPPAKGLGGSYNLETLEQYFIEMDELDPAEHFSRQLYEKAYKDVAASGLDSYFHYVKFGRHEGRLSSIDILSSISINEDRIKPDRPFIVIGAHEASRTGAPLVAVALADVVQQDFNVIFISFHRGSLETSLGDRYAAFFTADGDRTRADFLLGYLSNRFDIQRAILSSCECEPLMVALANCGIPFTILVHEYSENTFPKTKIYHTLIFSELTVFSSRHLQQSWQPHIDEIQLPKNHYAVRPQPAPAKLDEAIMDREVARRLVADKTNMDLADKTLIIGAGTVMMRKGTDLFLQIADSLTRRHPGRFAFIWIGDGLNEADLHFGVWLTAYLDKVIAHNPNVMLVPAGPLYHPLLDAADGFLLSSRLDPLPNVALDALERRQPVFFFENAGGISELIRPDLLPKFSAPYLDTSELVQRIVDHFCSDEDPARERSNPDRLLATNRPKDGYEGYFKWLTDTVQEPASGQITNQLGDTIDEAYVFDPTGGERPFWNDEPSGSRVRRLVTSMLARGIAYCNPAPGISAAHDKNGNLIRYESRSVDNSDKGIRVSEANVHFHVFYPELIDRPLELLGQLDCPVRLFITTDSADKAQSIEEAVKDLDFVSIEIVEVPNQGRDIGPFLDHALDYFPTDPTAIIGHLHTKKSDSSSAEAGKIWRNRLYDNLLCRGTLKVIAEPDVGLVFPEDHRCVGWGYNFGYASQIAGDVLKIRKAHPGPFPIGSMFWAKQSIVEIMRNQTRETHWPLEPVGYDGSALHAIERLWPAACEAGELNWVATYRQTGAHP